MSLTPSTFLLFMTCALHQCSPSADQETTPVSDHWRLVRDLTTVMRLRGITIIFSLSPEEERIAEQSLSTTASKMAEVNQEVGFLRLPNDGAVDLITNNKKEATYVVLTDDDRTKEFLKQVSDAGGFSPPTVWWFLMKKSSTYSTLLEGLYLPFDSTVYVASYFGDGKLMVDLMETYNILRGGQLQKNDLGKWTELSGFAWMDPTKSMWQRRLNMEGVHFKVVTYQDIPFVFIDKNDNPGNPYFGYLPEAWEVLQGIFNFTTTYYTLPGKKEDMKEDNLIKEVQNGAAQVALAPIIPTSDQSKLVDFTSNVINLRFRMFIRRPNLENYWKSFIRPFDNTLWWLTVVTILLVPLLLTYCYMKGRQTGAEEQEGPYIFNMQESFLIIYGALLQQGSDFMPNSIASRVVFWMSFIFGVLMYTAYSAALISNLTIQKIEYPFLTLDQMMSSRGYKLNIVKDSITQMNLENAERGLLQAAYVRQVKNKPTRCVDSIQTGIQKVSDKGGVAFFDVYERVLGQLGPLGCRLLDIPTDYMHSQGSIALAKGTPYRKAFNFFLRKMIQSGVLSRMRIYWWSKVKYPCITSTVSKMGLEQVYLVFYCLLGGLVMSIVFLIGEVILKRVCKKMRKDQKTVAMRQWATRNPEMRKPLQRLGWGEMTTHDDPYEQRYRDEIMGEKYKGFSLPFLN